MLSCSHKVIVDEMGNLGNIMANVMNKKISMAQFDSLCVADTLPNNLIEWKFLGLKEYESNKRVSLFMYMKRSGTGETVYRLEETMDDSVKITKRIIE